MYVGFWSDPVSTGTIDPPPLIYFINNNSYSCYLYHLLHHKLEGFTIKTNQDGLFLLTLFHSIGWLIALVMLLDKGTPGKNRFGEYPLKSKKVK